jgi:hypothetical protein
MTFTLENAQIQERASFTPAGGEHVIITTWKYSYNEQAWYEACVRKHFIGNARYCYRSLVKQGWAAA